MIRSSRPLVQYVGQPLFAVAAQHYQRRAQGRAPRVVEYEPLPAILDIRSALAAESYVLPTRASGARAAA